MTIKIAQEIDEQEIAQDVGDHEPRRSSKP